MNGYEWLSKYRTICLRGRFFLLRWSIVSFYDYKRKHRRISVSLKFNYQTKKSKTE